MKMWLAMFVVVSLVVLVSRHKYGPDPAVPDTSVLGFSCQVATDVNGYGDNAGCHKVVACRSGMKIAHAKAVCNLEWGSVTQSQLSQVPLDRIRVVRASDNVRHGFCYVGKCVPPNPPAMSAPDDYSLCSNLAQEEGDRAISGIDGWTQVEIGCAEFDDVTGGECHILGELYCE
jgi:hypothetical protein